MCVRFRTPRTWNNQSKALLTGSVCAESLLASRFEETSPSRSRHACHWGRWTKGKGVFGSAFRGSSSASLITTSGGSLSERSVEGSAGVAGSSASAARAWARRRARIARSSSSWRSASRVRSPGCQGVGVGAMALDALLEQPSIDPYTLPVSHPLPWRRPYRHPHLKNWKPPHWPFHELIEPDLRST